MKGSVSSYVLGVDWDKFYPAELQEGIQIRKVSAEEGLAFLNKYFDEIYHRNQSQDELSFKEFSPPENKARYYEVFGDFFLIRDLKLNKDIGYQLGNVADWGSYNFRSVGILDSHKGLGIYPSAFELLWKALASAGVQKIEGHVCPSNHQHLHILNKLGAIIQGTVATENFGFMYHLVVYLNKESRDFFVDRYSQTKSSDRSSNKKFKMVS